MSRLLLLQEVNKPPRNSLKARRLWGASTSSHHTQQEKTNHMAGHPCSLISLTFAWGGGGTSLLIIVSSAKKTKQSRRCSPVGSRELTACTRGPEFEPHTHINFVGWCTPTLPALRKLRQEDQMFKGPPRACLRNRIQEKN